MVYAKQLSTELAKLGHDVTLLATRYIGTKSRRINTIYEVVEMPHYGYLFGANPLVNIFPWFIKNYKKYDIIHVHSYMFLTTFEFALLKKIVSYPFIIHVHGGLSSSINKSFRLLIKDYLYDRSFGSFTLRSADKIFSVSKLDISRISNLFNVSIDKINWLPNAVDFNKFRPQKKIKIAKNKIVLGFAGRLEKWKGADLLISIAKYLKDKNIDYQLNIVGHGYLENEIKEKVSELNLNIKFLGIIDHNNMPKFMNSIDILIVPSRVEGIPTVILEAMACGIPVVATNVGGIPEIVKNNKTGLISPPDPIKISKNIITLILNKELYNKVRDNALAFVRTNYRWEKVAKMAIKYYKHVLF